VEPAPFEVRREGRALRGEEVGDGPTIVLAHGLTATRRYVVHGSNALPRGGYRTISYDARGHGESDPAADGSGYGYPELAADLRAILGERAPGAPAVLAGHSMGAHTIAALALADPERVAAVVLIGPATVGVPLEPEALAEWDRLAEALERGGVEEFVRVNENPALAPRWRETVARITRERLGRHRHLDAVARALREVPRSMPFDGPDELEFLDLPALVVASRDEVDVGHPYAVAEAWAERLPRARLVSEPEGASPLAWQGGRLSREIAAFCAEPAVAERLGGARRPPAGA
jgi:pimeloyl-ACP methyl ester carboxylesterase